MIDMASLNQNQAEAVLWGRGPLLLLAGPGAGKTETLVRRVGRILSESEGKFFSILCLNFTKKAVAEMRMKLQELNPVTQKRAWLTTFHSFAADILRTHGNHIGLLPSFEIIEEVDRIAIIKTLLATHADKLSRFFSENHALHALDFLFAHVVPDDEVASRVQDPEFGMQMQALFIAYKAALLNQNMLDYGAMLYFSVHLLQKMPALVKHLRIVYPYVCVDDFQDASAVHYQLLRVLRPEPDANLFIAGDDDQVIFQWNGASPARMRQLQQDYQLKIIQLPVNYRCPPSVVEAANNLIAHNIDRMPRERQQSANERQQSADQLPPNREGLKYLLCDTDYDEAFWVAHEIKQVLNNGASPSQIVVLARTNSLLPPVAQALARARIAAHVHKPKAQFESMPMRFIVAALRLAVVRTDSSLAEKVAKAFSDCIVVDITLEALMAWATQTNGDYLEALHRLIDFLPNLSAAWNQGIAELLQGKYRAFIDRIFNHVDYLVKDNSGDGAFVGFFADYKEEREVWDEIVRTQATELPLPQFLQELVLASKTPLLPPDVVRCMTIHAAKGMSFNHVYLIGLVEGQLPTVESIRAGDTSREMEEERRLCYVAMTRAIEKLTLSFTMEHHGQASKWSRFIDEMRPEE